VLRLKAGRQETLILVIILVGAAALRLYGVTWDDGHWLHPDERQIYFVVADLALPTGLAEALTPDSPLNPAFFAYGSLSFYLLRLAATLVAPVWPALRDSGNLHLMGRLLAALADLSIVYLTYRLARALWPSPGRSGELSKGPLFSAALVGVALLHVQLAHFYTADTLLALFAMLTLNLAADMIKSPSRCRSVALGVALGLALATKISAAPLLAVVLVAHVPLRPIGDMESPVLGSSPGVVFRRMLLPIAVAGVVFVAAQPYALIDWRTFARDTLLESQIAWGALDVPFTRQYAGTLPYLYPIWQSALWGLGLPLGLAAWAGLGALLVRWLRRGLWVDTLLLAWSGPYLAVTGLLYARYLRYMLPLVPVLCILAVRLLGSVKSRRLRATGLWLLVAASLTFSLVFVSIYVPVHSWIETSEWIYRKVPAGSTLAVEDWDTRLPLPLDLDGKPRRIEEYDVLTLTLYEEPDDAAKWARLAADLSQSDYLILASRRLYGSIPRLPERYPLAGRYYDVLFARELGFSAVGEFTRGPVWLNPRLSPLPGAAPALLRPDESLVVYDHPRALVFRNAERLPPDELLNRITRTD
jgi:hypothetical protein